MLDDSDIVVRDGKLSSRSGGSSVSLLSSRYSVLRLDAFVKALLFSSVRLLLCRYSASSAVVGENRQSGRALRPLPCRLRMVRFVSPTNDGELIFNSGGALSDRLSDSKLSAC
jgi:hypothetical protein